MPSSTPVIKPGTETIPRLARDATVPDTASNRLWRSILAGLVGVGGVGATAHTK
jgi:hypothetical protein